LPHLLCTNFVHDALNLLLPHHQHDRLADDDETLLYNAAVANKITHSLPIPPATLSNQDCKQQLAKTPNFAFELAAKPLHAVQ
jgi:hypothetical protein